VVLVDAATGKTLWTYQPRLPTSLTGEPPTVFGTSGALLVLVPVGFGYQLERLDPATGSHLWPDALRLSRRPLAGPTAAVEAGAVYYVTANVLHARSLADGKHRWEQRLAGPGGAWQVVRTAAGLAVYPIPQPAVVWSGRIRPVCRLPVGWAQVPVPLPRL